MLICHSVQHMAAYRIRSDAVVWSFFSFSYWGKGVIADFNPTGLWACACACVGPSYSGGATGARGKIPPVKGVWNIIIRNASASARPHHRVHRRLFVSHVFLIYISVINYDKVDCTAARV